MASTRVQALPNIPPADPLSSVHAEDGQAELAALEAVELELAAVRERRHRMEVAEAGLWARRNHLEQVLIERRGAAWWRARQRSLRDLESVNGGDAHE
jgi:hypothetical protein